MPIELEGVAETCGMLDVSYHLRKAKLAWMGNHGSRERKQTRVRDFFGDGKEAVEGASGWTSMGREEERIVFCT